jgi:hypothetical protein
VLDMRAHWHFKSVGRLRFLDDCFGDIQMSIRFSSHALLRLRQRFGMHIPELTREIERRMERQCPRLAPGQRLAIHGYVRLRKVRVILVGVEANTFVIVSAMWVD